MECFIQVWRHQYSISQISICIINENTEGVNPYKRPEQFFASVLCSAVSNNSLKLDCLIFFQVRLSQERIEFYPNLSKETKQMWTLQFSTHHSSKRTCILGFRSKILLSRWLTVSNRYNLSYHKFYIFVFKKQPLIPHVDRYDA